MNDKIYLNQNICIDLPTLLDTRLLVEANSGGGKSWLLRRILEQSHGKVQQIVIDLEGEFSTLREKYDYVLAGHEGDTPADPKSAALLARKLLELNVSAIIDLYELHYQERKHFVRLFLESMINAPKTLWHSCLVVIDEAHKFCPEKETSEASSAVIDLATLGRKRGFCAILATQRISKLNKDVAAECNNKLIGRTGLDIDRKRAGEELGFTTKEQVLSLRNLDAGEFFAFGPAISPEVIQVQIGSVQTTHPKAGSRIAAITPIPPTEKIRKILGALKDLPQEAEEEAHTIEALQGQVEKLKRQLTQKNQGTEKAVPSKEIDTAVQRALDSQRQLFDQERTDLQTTIQHLEEVIENAITSLSTTTAKQPAPKPTNTIPVKTNSKKGRSPQTKPSPTHPPGAGMKRILHVLASRYPLTFTKTQLATLAQLSSSDEIYSSLSQLRSKGHITIESNQISITQQGLEESGITPEQPENGKHSIDMWRENLSGGARRIFDFLVASYPAGFTRKEIANHAGLTARSGTFDAYISILHHNGLIDRQGDKVKASETLFT